MRNCSKCKEPKPDSDFQIRNGKPNGQCRACKTANMKAHRAANGIKVRNLTTIIDGFKTCASCKEPKPLSDFWPNKRGRGKVSANCKVCTKDLFYDPEKARQATIRYRRKNRFRHLALHRVRMFEYRTYKKVTSDGSVTDDFLAALYAEVVCSYCKQDIPEEDRTADHRVPLSRGGTHTADNLVMACQRCNSAKSATDETTFRKERERRGEHCSSFNQPSRDRTGELVVEVPENDP